jgi:hypothetical protein
MSMLASEPRAALLRWELPFVYLLAWAALVSIPLAQQGMGLSWDALNHHFYLGWISEGNRFDRDILAALYQSFQFPYLYWPVYKMAATGWSGTWAGVVLATLQTVLVPPLWMLARTCMPGRTVFDVTMRLMAVALALISGVVLAQFAATSNDLLAAIPLVWALALALTPLDGARPAWLNPGRSLTLSAMLSGVAIACKLSNGPLVVVVMPVLWGVVMPGSPLKRLVHVTWGLAAVLLGFVLVYGYWGAQLWAVFGNPIYPFYDSMFESVRAWTGWAP